MIPVIQHEYTSLDIFLAQVENLEGAFGAFDHGDIFWIIDYSLYNLS